jgi:hypothetical protein
MAFLTRSGWNSSARSYASRAVASLDRQATTEKHPPIPESTRSASQEVRWPKGEDRLNGLTAEQWAQRFDKTKLALFQETPFLAHSWKKGSKLHESMIRNRMVRDLAVEPMDLLPLSVLPNWYAPHTQNLGL